MAELVRGLTPERVRANLGEVRAEIAAAAAQAGRAPGDVELVAAVKYVAAEDLPVLVEAGLTAAGENVAQELERKVAAPGGDALAWDFIGQLQSRKVKVVAPLVRRIHSVASESARSKLAAVARADLELLVQVNIAGEDGKAGIAPDALAAFLDAGGVDFGGLSVMPPLASDPQDSRRWFAAARELADRHGLAQLSMGTTQDFAVAVQEGATIVRVGSRLYR